MKGWEIKEISSSSRGMYIRNIADIIPNWKDICNTADIPELAEMFGCLIYKYTCYALKVKEGINNVPR